MRIGEVRYQRQEREGEEGVYKGYHILVELVTSYTS